jgi:hypothetical protein
LDRLPVSWRSISTHQRKAVEDMFNYHGSGINRRQFCAALSAALFGAGGLSAADETATRAAAGSEGLVMPNLVSKTAGGKQFWADVWFFHDWRVQRNVLTGHCRLLDGANRRHAWGTFDACHTQLEEIRRRDNLPVMEGKAVIVLHGLFRTRSAMQPLCKVLGSKGGYKAFAMGYPTTRGSVGDHAQSLDSVVRSLESMEEMNFVAHSLGNLVVRYWLQDLVEQARTLPPGQRFGRMVMLAPPNHHPQIAAKLLSTDLAAMVAGPAAEQLATGWSELEPHLATPPFEFGILAGGKGDGRGYNPLIPGDDDAVITVESTRLPGACDFRRLPVLHSFIMNAPQIQEMTLRFLSHGYFESDASRQPIVAAVEPEPARGVAVQ